MSLLIRTSVRNLLTVLSGVTALAACSGEAGDADSEGAAVSRTADQVQMNDVSVLYPMAKTADEMDGYLAASDQGVGGALLPAKLYTDATGQPKSNQQGGAVGTDRGMAYDDLRVIAFRVDPCFANIGPVTKPSSCKNQLRLVFQALSVPAGNSPASAVDGAVHAFYSLTRDELVGLLKDIVALRQKESRTADLGPLAVHPVLASQGLLGDEAKGLNALVLKHAGTKNLVRFTDFTPGGLATKWTFEGFDVENGKSTNMVIPTLPSKSTSVVFFAGFSQPDLAGNFTPATEAKDNMQLLASLEESKKSPADAKNAFDAALRIQNPNMHSPDTIDCASCHVAGPAVVLTGQKLGLSAAKNTNAFSPDAKFVSAAAMKQTTPIGNDTSRNFHAFSYRNGNPMVSMRVINETASVVAYVNGNLLNAK
jgi:hypothetical protein